MCDVHYIAEEDKTEEKNTSVEWSEIYVLICLHVSIGMECCTILVFSLFLPFSFSIVPFHFNSCAYLSLVAGFAVIKGKSNQIGLRIVNGVTCTTRIAADVRWMRHDVFPVLRMQFHSFAG